MGTLQIEPVAWSVSVDAAPPSEVIDELHIAQNQRRVEKTIDFWIREKSFAAVLSDDWVASTRYGIDRRTGRVVWQAKPYFPRRFWWKYTDLWQLRSRENVLVPLQIEKNILVATSVGINGENVGVFRIDVTNGEWLRLYRGASWLNRLQEVGDTCRHKTVERQINPLAVRGGEIIGQSGVVLSTQKGRVLRREKRKRSDVEDEWKPFWIPERSWERNESWTLLNVLKKPSCDLLGRKKINGVGTLLEGTPENAIAEKQYSELDIPAFYAPVRERKRWSPRGRLRPASPNEWFLRRDDGSVAWAWDTRNLSERLGDETLMETRRLKIHAPYLFYLHCVSALENEPKEEWEAIAAPFNVFVVAQDLRDGSISSIRQVGKEPILGPMLEAVDENGLLIRSFDRRLFYLPITSGR